MQRGWGGHVDCRMDGAPACDQRELGKLAATVALLTSLFATAHRPDACAMAPFEFFDSFSGGRSPVRMPGEHHPATFPRFSCMRPSSTPPEQTRERRATCIS